MEFGLLVTHISVYVSCKFEMYIFKVAQVISENVRIAFLYVLSIFPVARNRFCKQLRSSVSVMRRCLPLISSNI